MSVRATILLLCSLTAACAAIPASESGGKWALIIYNANWYAHTVRMDCTVGGNAPIRERQLILGERRQTRHDFSCREYTVTVEGMGRRFYRFPQPIQIHDGGSICVDIGSTITQTFVYGCTRGA